ncbi:MAG: helix-turn-helix domain-containing protein [Planctomycetes bacterium]|nr:helix-turn-helix domain-containing protein [Planctomycetota bacterium]
MTEEAKSEDVFKDGPIKQQKQPEIRNGKRREKALDRLRLQGFWPIYVAFLAAAITPPLAEDTGWKIAIRLAGIGIAILGLLMRICSFGYLLTQAELAKRTGIHRPNIARVEAGRHTPSLETLSRLTVAIGVPATRVFQKS